MRILISGFVVFVIWCIISAWLYNDKLLPQIKSPVTVKALPESQTNAADSLMKLKASMPGHLLIFFDFDKSNFKTDPYTDSSIAELKTWLERHEESTLIVSGNTDLVGTAEYNKALGMKRASIIGKYLETKGISSNRIIMESKGEENPVAEYLTAEGRAKNRRTEILIKMQ
jgi:outer membrane protein OmpA-like peptidoglycan-associated protein